MPTVRNKIEAEALNLDIQARARLAGKLLMSLDDPSVSEVEQLWLNEAERRLEEYRSGKCQGVPASEVFQRAIADLS
uniref:Addiction module antitoxin RelB n=1 Tax=Geobacter metallireducens TaxID=28232 RepID=A0A831U1Q1_GEOME